MSVQPASAVVPVRLEQRLPAAIIAETLANQMYMSFL
jgi:hypothetical protein